MFARQLCRAGPSRLVRAANLRAFATTPIPRQATPSPRFSPLERMRGRTQQAAAPAKAPNHKPPKRRLEAASLPLRNNLTPSRGPILQCIAHTTAERYDLPSLAAVLRRMGVRWDEVPEGDRDRAFVIGPWKGRGGAERLICGKDVPTEADEVDTDADLGFGYGERGEVWVFGSGSFVTWGLTEEEGRVFLREVIRGPGSRVEAERLPLPECEVEEVDFVADPTAKTSILGNLILLGGPPELSTFPPSPSLASLLARYTLSLSLTRSSSLGVLESRLDKHIASVSLLPRALERYGQQPLGRREVIRKIGELMTLRMAVNTRGGGLDETPEFYWSEPELEDYFDSVAKEFEIKERIDTINKKIDYAQEMHDTLRALLTEASGHRMEIIIILLIAVEVVFLLIREGPELWEELVHPTAEMIHRVLAPLVTRSTPSVREAPALVEPAKTSEPRPQSPQSQSRRLV